MRTPSPRLALVVAAALTASACSASASGEQATPPPAAAPAVPARLARTGALPRLVFFMNPNGGPCRMQDRILQSMAGELAGRAELVYYRTTEPADLAVFDRFGIRSLPTLVLTDASGTELRRATPGIQGQDEIRRLVGP